MKKKQKPSESALILSYIKQVYEILWYHCFLCISEKLTLFLKGSIQSSFSHLKTELERKKKNKPLGLHYLKQFFSNANGM